MLLCLALLPICIADLSEVVPNSTVEIVAQGFQYTEGPVWDRQHGYLLFSDIPANTIHKYDPKNKTTTVFRKHVGGPNGLALDCEGRLIVCEQIGRRIVRVDSKGDVEVLASEYDGKPLNSPNDLVISSEGSVYFTDPPFGIKPEQQEQPFCGIYRLLPDGALMRLIEDFDRPNGLGLSPDGKLLYIIDTAKKQIRVFDVRSDGKLTNSRVFADVETEKFGIPDGMEVDCRGNVYTGGQGGVWIFSAEGRHLGTVPTPKPAVNFAWGDSDGKTLYITAHNHIYRLLTTTGRCERKSSDKP